jgi:transcriptional regulator with XRE-family HTH domain
MIVSPNDEEDPKVLRKKAGLTVRAVAQALDVTITTVTRWESGSSTPTLSLKQTITLINLYGCSLDQLDRAFTKARRERELKNKQAEETAKIMSTSSRS